MFTRFKKKSEVKDNQQEESVYEKRAIAVFSPYGQDASLLSKQLGAEVSDSVIVEFPCHGIPRLSNEFPEGTGDTSKSIDQLLLDSDRNEMKSYEHYIQTISGQKLIMATPNSSPLLPVLLRLQHTRTCINIPFQLKLS